MKLLLLALIAAIALQGCPPPCQPPETLQVDEMDPELVGKWSGIATSPSGQEFFCDFTFRQEGTFLLEFHFTAGEVGTVSGEWGTMYFEHFALRLDLAIGCTNFTDLQNPNYRVWNYEIAGDRLTAGIPGDFMLGPEDLTRNGAYYELNRVD